MTEQQQQANSANGSRAPAHIDEINDNFGGSLLDEANILDPASHRHQFPSNKWRAKLYQLNPEGSWDDLGTG